MSQRERVLLELAEQMESETPPRRTSWDDAVQFIREEAGHEARRDEITGTVWDFSDIPEIPARWRPLTARPSRRPLHWIRSIASVPRRVRHRAGTRTKTSSSDDTTSGRLDTHVCD